MRYARIRELNAEVRTLKKQLGQATPLDGLGALITDIDDKMSKFWRGMGFSFPDVQFGKYSIKATFRVRFEMHASDMSNKPFSIKQLRQARAEEIEKAGVETAYIRDEREMSFFDSENNRTYFISLLKDAFPDIRIEKFQNRLARDGGTKMSGVAEQSLQQIMAELDPAKQKKLGRQVKNFDAAKWNSVSREVVFQGNLFKFQQHDQLRNLLLKTENSLLVEASPFDKIWGIGLGPDDPRAKNPEQWQGTNWLGEELMRVRDSGTLYEI
jgi:ribA/ribD-fused uncharacterized protein